jgi:hypothetical protein
MATLAAAALAGYEIRRTALRRGPDAWREVRVQEDRAIRVRLGDGSLVTGRLAPTTYVGSSLVALHVRADGARRLRTTFVIARMTGAEQFRRLKVLLRLSFDPTRARHREGVPVRVAGALPMNTARGPSANALRRHSRASHSRASIRASTARAPPEVADSSNSR